MPGSPGVEWGERLCRWLPRQSIAEFRADRVRVLVDRPPRAGGEFVLYWMIAQRRLGWNFALDRAIAWAEELGKPLVVLEALRCDYRWASDRIHRFVIEGMAENARRAAGKRLLYVPYVEPEVGAGKGLLRALSQRACVIVTDDFPCFFLPRMVEAAAAPGRLPPGGGRRQRPLPPVGDRLGFADRLRLSADPAEETASVTWRRCRRLRRSTRSRSRCWKSCW